MGTGGRATSGIHESCIRNVTARRKKYINMLIIKSARFIEKNAKQERYIFKYLRRHVDLNLRSFAFICGLGLPEHFSLLKPRRVSNGLLFCAPLLAGFHGASRCSGRDPGADMKQGGAPAL
jgi:hypothetical protein